MTEAIPKQVVDTVCAWCGHKGLWKPQPFKDGKETIYNCVVCGNDLIQEVGK